MRAVDQKKILDSLNWDHLIVLDACRYDFFARLWDMPNSIVIKAKSPASWTLEWLVSIFQDKFMDDVVFFSSTPYVSNYKLSLHGYEWEAKRHFGKIINIWKSAWDNELGTVLPHKVYNYVKLWRKLNKLGRSIIWFLQPHYPPIILRNIIMKSVGQLSSSDFFSGRMDLMIRNLILNSDLVSIFNYLYYENLRISIMYVKKLLEILNGKIVITSDHGELLGELFIKECLLTVTNVMEECFRLKSINLLKKRLQLLHKAILWTIPTTKPNISYLKKGRVYFHSPLLFSDNLRTVPLVIVKGKDEH